MRHVLASSRLVIALIAAWLLSHPAPAQSADAAKGRALYEKYCLMCHGPEGRGDGPVGKALTPPPRNFAAHQFKFDTDGDGKKGTDADLKNVIRNGAGKFGGSPLMAPWMQLSDADVANLIAYIRTFHKQ